MLTRVVGTIAVAISLALLAPGCSQAREPTPTATVTQELRVNLGGEPSTLDPQLATGLHELSVIRQVFEGLLGWNPDLTLKPVVATQVPSVENGGISQDGLVYTFKLRDDVTWSDGRKVTANDFAFAIKRLLDPEVAAPFSYLYLGIRGGQEYSAAVGADGSTRQALENAVAVEAPDEHTLRVTLTEPSLTFLQKMALSWVYPVRRDVVENSGTRWTEAGTYVGNGPFIMTEWVHQDHITLEANPNYWGPRPRLTRITYRMIADPNAELAAYRNGELHLSQLPPGNERGLLADPSLGQEVVRSPQLFTFGLFFNTAAAPFEGVAVRQAFATAIDREAWIDKVKNGVGKPATSWLPPGMPGYDPALGNEYAFDPDRARQLLAQGGFATGKDLPRVSYTFVDAGEQRLIAEFIQAQLKENLGVEVTLEPLDPPAFFQQVIAARSFQLTGIGWGADYPHPESFLVPLFVTGAGNNISQYGNSEFDHLVALASRELDQEAALELWRRAHGILVKDAPVAFFFHGERLFLKKPYLQGLTLTPIDGAIPGDTMLGEVLLTR
ncbi:MAG: ABC-type oligopeptide transport system, periplasmic component [Dehalococcoidia bacterium]|nr:ABC-type oligopeptide transport system, periplasmic component [Dehalococcoidia bacterium]